MNIEWKRKLTSRKFWMALAGFIAGVIAAFGGSENTASTVSGCILQGAAVVSYLLAEGLADASSAQNTDLKTDIKAVKGFISNLEDDER